MAEADRREAKKLRRLTLRLLGPGLVTGAADDDPSGIATYSQAGAQFGYGLLWSVLFTTPLMIGIQFVPAGVRLTFKGLPGRAYQILRVAELNKPWTLIGTTTTGVNGAGEFIDISGNQGACRMYKLVVPSNP
jgi:hypothetical protein